MSLNQDKLKIFAQKLMPYMIILLTSFLLILPFLCKSKIGGHDMLYHFSAINALDTAYQNGTFFSRIYELTCQDYGYASGIFYSMIPAGFAVIVKNILHISAFASVVLELIFVLFLSGLFAYKLLNLVSKNKTFNLILCLIYICSPYVLSNFYIRFAFTEMFLTFLIPMIAISLYNLVEKQNYKAFIVYFVIGFALSIMIHMALSIFITLISALYLLLNIKKIWNKHIIFIFFVSCLFVVLISTAFWLPVLKFRSNINLDAMGNEGGKLYFSTFHGFIFDKKNYHLVFSNLFLLIVYFVFLILFIKNRKTNTKNEVSLLILVSMLVALITPVGIIWVALKNSFFNMIQYSWRLYLILSLFSLFEIDYIIRKFNKKYLKVGFSVVLVTIIIIAFVVNNNGYYFYSKDFNSNVNYLSTNNGMGSGKLGDYLPSEATTDYIFSRVNDNLIISTDVIITELANFQSKNQINFVVADNQNGYVDLKLPYMLCENLKIYQFETFANTDCYELEILSAMYFEGEYLKIEFNSSNFETKIVLDYSGCDKLKEYLLKNPFEFKILSGDENVKISNFKKQSVNNYTFDITNISTKTTIELPTLYYSGYRAKIKTNGIEQDLEMLKSENGFLMIEVEEDSIVTIEFKSDVIKISNIISLFGIISFVIFAVFYLNFAKIKNLIKNKKSG